MQLSSVLEKKQQLGDELTSTRRAVPRAIATTFAASASRSILARRLDDVHTRSPEATKVALGIARGKRPGDYRLGARIQVKGPAARGIAARILESTRGEADIRITPNVTKRHHPPAWFRRRHRPLEAGISCGHHKITAGTLGFIVEDDDAWYALSNNHVLADVNKGEPGDPIIQPGPIDIAGPSKKRVNQNTLIGVLDRFVPISFNRSNVVDCAVAELLPDLSFYPGWTEALPGNVKGFRELGPSDLGLRVLKAGRTTGITRGRITQVKVDRLSVNMGSDSRPKWADFSNQVEVLGDDGKLFSDGGDSGSLIVDEQGYARALLFAGGADSETGEDVTFANRIELVLAKLGVKLTLS